MSIIIAGKRAPEFKQLVAAIHEGFENLELYLEEKHLDNFGFLVDNILLAQKEAAKVLNRKLNIVSIHTPHTDKIEYFNKTVELAKKFDAWIIFHSYKINIMADFLDSGKIEKYDKIAIENSTTFDIKDITKHILGRGYFLCLDTAHFYMGAKNFANELDLLLENYADKIRIVHLADAIKTKDGLAIGDGDIEFGTLCTKLASSGMNGIITIEVPVEKQLESWQKVAGFFRSFKEQAKKQKPQNIKAIIFDADKTLYNIKTERAYGVIYEYLSEKLKAPKEEIENEHKEEIARISRSQDPKQRDYRFSIKKVVESHTKENIALITEEANAKFWNIVVEDLIEKPLVKEVVDKLSKKYILAIASDEFRIILERKLTRIFSENKWQAYFDFIVTNDDTKVMKPSAEYYRIVLDKMDLNPEDVIVVGDSWNRDLKPAKELGIKTVLIANTPDGEPDYFYTSFGGLEEILDV